MTNAEIKKAVRSTPEWRSLRKSKFDTQLIDPVTERPLAKNANLHHGDLNVEHYSNLSPERFMLLNHDTHECVHFIYGNERVHKDWRRMLKNLEKICMWMDKLNNVV